MILTQYNYVLSAALDIGTALSALVIFLTLDLSGASLNWWGNSVYKNSELLQFYAKKRRSDVVDSVALDWSGNSAYKLAPADGFGPSTWKV